MTVMADRYSERWLATRLSISRELLLSLALNPDSHYRTFLDHQPGKKPRTIDNPDNDLMAVQRRIRSRLLAHLPLPPHVHGCVKTRSSLTNALTHCGAPNVASVDIKNFYPNVTNRAIYDLWQRLGYGPPLASLLTRLTTKAGHLPQGAPTSDALANHVLAPLDDALIEIAATFGLQLSRYLDNIDVSGVRTREAIPFIINLLQEHGFAVRHKKTFNVGPNRRRVVTGYTVNNARLPSVPRAEQRRIRSAAHELVREHRLGKPITALAQRLRGRLAHLRRTNPATAAAIDMQLAAKIVDW